MSDPTDLQTFDARMLFLLLHRNLSSDTKTTMTSDNSSISICGADMYLDGLTGEYE